MRPERALDARFPGETPACKVLENLKAYPMDKFSMYRDGHMDDVCKVEIAQ